VELVIEVADATLGLDLGPKCRSYARNGIRCYWVVDIPNQILHVFTRPTGPVDEPSFLQHQMLKGKDRVPLRIKDQVIAELKVAPFFD
jgi:hypothetical protein